MGESMRLSGTRMREMGTQALFLGGARSDYLGAEAEAAVSRYFPAAGIARIAEAGHWVHAEAPEAFLRAVAAFLDLDLSG